VVIERRYASIAPAMRGPGEVRGSFQLAAPERFQQQQLR
jgi:hypothetical protein